MSSLVWALISLSRLHHVWSLSFKSAFPSQEVAFTEYLKGQFWTDKTGLHFHEKELSFFTSTTSTYVLETCFHSWLQSDFNASHSEFSGFDYSQQCYAKQISQYQPFLCSPSSFIWVTSHSTVSRSILLFLSQALPKDLTNT